MSPIWLSYENQLLSRLGEADIALLAPRRRVELPTQNAIEVAGQRIDCVYFIEHGFASVVSSSGDDGLIEVGLVGHEGMTGFPLLHGVDVAPFTTFAQTDLLAICVSAESLHQALSRSETLRSLLLRYAQAFSVQMASTSSANGRLLLEQRLARWLLMVADRMGENFRVTHESLASMLAVRRPGVTTGLSRLEDRGFIRTMRGAVAVVDRKGLEAFTAGAYGMAEEQYHLLVEDFEPGGEAENVERPAVLSPADGGR